MQQDSKGQAVEVWDARQSDRKYVGLDVHKATIAVAVADEGRGEVRSYGTIKNTPEAVAKLVKRLETQLKQAATVGRHGPLIAALQSLRGWASSRRSRWWRSWATSGGSRRRAR